MSELSLYHFFIAAAVTFAAVVATADVANADAAAAVCYCCCVLLLLMLLLLMLLSPQAVREHCVVESKPEGNQPDLRISQPWPELLEYCQFIDFEKQVHTDCCRSNSYLYM